MSGYRRPTNSALDCVLSSFQMTNETRQHLDSLPAHLVRNLSKGLGLELKGVLRRAQDCLGPRAAVGVSGGSGGLSTCPPQVLPVAPPGAGGGLGFRSEPYHWPLLVFLLPACLYPFASCCAHTFSSMSPRRHICYFLDYGALSLYSLGEPHAAGRGGSFRQGGVWHRVLGGPQLPPRPAPRLRLPLCLLLSMHPASWLQPPAPALCARRRTQFFLCTGLSCYSRWVLGRVVKGKAEDRTGHPTNTWTPRTAGCACAHCS